MTSEPSCRLAVVAGKNIRELRIHQGLSIRELALMLGMDHAYLWRIEKGIANPTISRIGKIAIALDVPLSAIFKE